MIPRIERYVRLRAGYPFLCWANAWGWGYPYSLFLLQLNPTLIFLLGYAYCHLRAKVSNDADFNEHWPFAVHSDLQALLQILFEPPHHSSTIYHHPRPTQLRVNLFLLCLACLRFLVRFLGRWRWCLYLLHRKQLKYRLTTLCWFLHTRVTTDIQSWNWKVLLKSQVFWVDLTRPHMWRSSQKLKQ